MGRNRRQERLRERRDRAPEDTTSRPPTTARSGGALSSSPKPPWRQTIDSWGGFTVIGAIVAAVVVAGLLVYVNRPGSTAGGGEFEARERNAPVNGAVIGDPNAPVRLIEYGDFQCPHCKTFFDTVEPMLMEEYVYTGVASFEYRNYAFLGSESRRAAEAALCAADQNRFFDYHDLLFQRQGRQNSGVFSDGNLRRYAGEIGDVYDDFDVAAWESCFNNGTHEATVLEQNQNATNSGIASTPTLLVNGRAIEGVQSVEAYRDAIDQALQASGGSN